ncbi:MAG: rod shape-determining protein RodA [Bacteroidota bacterium]
MIRQGDRTVYNLDWVTVLIYFVLVFLGWFNIYAAVYDEELNRSIFDLTLDSGKQLLFIGSSLLIIIGILNLDYKFYDSFGFIFYGALIFLLIFVLLFGREVAGSRSWFEIGAFRLQPSEFTKFATALAIAKNQGSPNVKVSQLKTQLISAMIIGIPMILVILQGDTGTAMVYGSFILVFFREGMSPLLVVLGILAVIVFILTLVVNQTVLIIGLVVVGLIAIGLSIRSPKSIISIVVGVIVAVMMVKSVDFVMSEVLKPHQQKRVMSLINPSADPLGIGWNVTQSKIAIGSGGFFGKGFLEGTQTKFDFVPAQSTDFIFCTIGEEHGWVGSLILVGGFCLLFFRLIHLAERQKSNFSRIYGYGVISVIFFHFAVNIAMTIGLFPVIGIPLPFFSYGGSSLWSFTILLFVFLKLDAHRMQVLMR